MILMEMGFAISQTGSKRKQLQKNPGRNDFPFNPLSAVVSRQVMVFILFDVVFKAAATMDSVDRMVRQGT